MPSLETRRWLITYAATVLLQSELPVSLEELFPTYINGAGTSRQLGRKLQRSIMDAMLQNSMVSIRKIDGIDHYEVGSNRSKTREVSCHEDEIGDMADVFGMSEGQMKLRRYSAKEMERRGKLSVAVRCITKLLAQKTPSPRAQLFTPMRGNKFEERAAWTPNWHTPYLEGLVGLGFIRAIEGNPVTYEVTNREELQKVADGKGKGPTCPYTLLYPDTPCTDDHSNVEGPYSGTLPDVGSNPELEDSEELTEEQEQAKQEIVKALDGLPPEEAKGIIQEAIVELDNPKPPEPTGLEDVSDRELQQHTADMLVKVMEALMSHSKTHTLILNSFHDMAKELINLRGTVSELKDEVNVAEDAAIEMQKKQEKAYEVIDSFSNQLAQIKKRLGDVDKVVTEQRDSATRHQEVVRKSVGEVAQLLAQVAVVKPEPLDPLVQAIQELREEIAKVAARPPRPRLPRVLLDRLNTAVDELGAVRDLTLDTIPSKKTA